MRRRRTLAEYFLALPGVGFLLFFLGIILSPSSCRVQTGAGVPQNDSPSAASQ